MNARNQLIPEAGHCKWLNKTKLDCFIHSFWSNGERVTASDFIRSFQHLVDPKTASPRAWLLKNLRNGKAIIQSQKPPHLLGAKALATNQLRIELANPDPEFLYKLSSTALLPIHKNHSYHKKDFKHFVSNGPYQISYWKSGKSLRLQPNPFYKKAHKNRPSVEFVFIEDEMTAYRLYLNHQLHFLRRVPSHLITQLKGRKDFHQIPMARFDYVGFGPELMKDQKLRQALIHSIDYKTLQDLLGARGRPGCPSIPSDWMDQVPCYGFEPKKARKLLRESPYMKTKRPLQLKLSQMGGKDIKKQGEFFQNQWKKHLAIEVQISQMDQKSFLHTLRTNPPDLFRKGVGLDRPTCLNALETFNEESKQNFLSWKDQTYFQITENMSKPTQLRRYRKMCQQAIERLMESFAFIPLGEIHFSILASPLYQGWSLNSMNQLDLGGLYKKPNHSSESGE